MDALATFRKTVLVSKFIESNLEYLARVVDGARIVDGTESKTAVYNNLIVDLKQLFPATDPDALANELITEQCRVAYIKMMWEKRPKSVGGRD
jgi:hypothetical protein